MVRIVSEEKGESGFIYIHDNKATYVLDKLIVKCVEPGGLAFVQRQLVFTSVTYHVLETKEY
jgi:hypothetical protein